jgi:hypothetical protein
VKELSSQIKMKDTEPKKFKILEDKIDKLEFKLKEVVESTGNNVPRIKCVNCDYSSTKHIELEKHITAKHVKVLQVKKCKFCKETFKENFELESHLKTHKEAETYDCEKCDKTFVLKWRLRKHQGVHETDRYCHYYNNQKFCPFEKLGCKFRHEQSAICKFQNCNNSLCQFRHIDVIDTEEALLKEVNNDSDRQTGSKESEFIIYKCKTCDRKFTSQEDLTNHDVKIHEAEKKSDEYSKFLKEQQSKMKNMTPTELFNLVEVIRNRN